LRLQFIEPRFFQSLLLVLASHPRWRYGRSHRALQRLRGTEQRRYAAWQLKRLQSTGLRQRRSDCGVAWCPRPTRRGATARSDIEKTTTEALSRNLAAAIASTRSRYTRSPCWRCRTQFRGRAVPAAWRAGVLDCATIALQGLIARLTHACGRRPTCPQQPEAKLHERRTAGLPLVFVGRLQSRDQIVNCRHRTRPPSH